MTKNELIILMVGNELMKDISRMSDSERSVNYKICQVVNKVKMVISNMEKCELLKDIMSK